MKYLLTIALVLSLVNCTQQTKQTAAETMAATVAPAISTALSCSHPDIVKADVLAQLDTWFKVNPQSTEAPNAAAVDKGVVGSICTAAVGAILPMLIDFASSKIKPTWGCTGTLVGQGATQLAQTACGLIPMSVEK